MSTGPETMTGRLMTAAEVAERWAVTKAHVYRLTREDRLPTVHLGRYRRYRLEAIEAFEIGGGTAGADAQSEGNRHG